ncbi:MAG: aspartate/glutamate racemase family protein [bacterium]
MKTIGLIGGTMWVSTAEYYRRINEGINKKLGGLDFARCILFSLNYGDIDRYSRTQDFQQIHSLLLDASKKVVAAGAECIALCANTMHYYADDLEREINVPLIHIGTATAKEIQSRKISTVGLLGTRMTMEKDFYKSKLHQYGITTLVPDEGDREYIHRAIDTELSQSVFSNSSRERFLRIIGNLSAQGAQGIVLGCTEIPLLVKQEHSTIPLFDTIETHTKAILEFALQ